MSKHVTDIILELRETLDLANLADGRNPAGLPVDACCQLDPMYPAELLGFYGAINRALEILDRDGLDRWIRTGSFDA